VSSAMCAVQINTVVTLIPRRSFSVITLFSYLMLNGVRSEQEKVLYVTKESSLRETDLVNNDRVTARPQGVPNYKVHNIM
jgi:hypothetical protein